MTADSDHNEHITHLQPKKLSFAISAVLAAPASVAMAQDQDQDAASSLVLEEVLVTARQAYGKPDGHPSEHSGHRRS